MNNYERLENLISEVPIHFMDDMPKGLDGIYKHGNIYMRNGMEFKENVQVLAEEIGHHYTSVGDISNYKDIRNKKQELKARRFGYELLITLDEIVAAFKASLRTVHELAEHFDVTDQYVAEAINHYRMKFGEFTYHKQYLIYFYPNLRVMELQAFES